MSHSTLPPSDNFERDECKEFSSRAFVSQTEAHNMISSSFAQSSLLYPTKSFLVSAAKIDSDHSKRNGDHPTTSVLTYQEANHGMKKCRNWMITQLEEAVTNLCGHGCNHEIEILLAFLSTNSPELVLAIMAALDICALRGTSSSNNLITFRLAMLNARWTPP